MTLLKKPNEGLKTFLAGKWGVSKMQRIATASPRPGHPADIGCTIETPISSSLLYGKPCSKDLYFSCYKRVIRNMFMIPGQLKNPVAWLIIEYGLPAVFHGMQCRSGKGKRLGDKSFRNQSTPLLCPPNLYRREMWTWYLIRGNHPLSLVIAMRNPFHNFVSICLKNIKDFGSVFNYSCNYAADCKDCWATLKLPLKVVNSLFSFTIWLKYQWNSNVKTQNFKDKLKWLATILGSRQLWILSQGGGAVGRGRVGNI